MRATDYLCKNHQHEWVGCLGSDEEGLLSQVAHRQKYLAVRKVLDEACRYVRIDQLPRPAEMRELRIVEMGLGTKRQHYNLWMERRCVV